MITVVLPTFAEADALRTLLPALLSALDGASMEAEVLVVDDASPDGTADAAEALLGARGRVLRRRGRPGLSRAALEGIRAAKGDIVVLMDADGEHPPALVPSLVRPLLDPASWPCQGRADVAVASRFAPGGGIEGRSALRRALSRAGAWLARGAARRGGADLRDPLSGFLAFRRSVVEGVPLGTLGFKIGLEVLSRGRYQGVVEVPYVHLERSKGRSKFGLAAVFAFFLQILLLRFSRRAESA